MSRLEQLRELAAAQPNDPLAQYGVGLECMQLERWEEAVVAFDRTLRIDGQYSAAYFQKARAQVKLGRRADAALTLQAGITAAELNGETHTVSEMRKLREALS